MEGPRPPQLSEFSHVLDFLNAQLRPGMNWSLEREYPTALTPTNLHNMRIITDASKVLSHAVVKPMVIKSPIAALKVAAIGSVVTDENSRNQGLSSKILADCLSIAQAQDCELAVLWTDLYDFYRKMDFELAGYEMSYVLDQEFTAPSEGLRFVNGPKVSPDAILRLYTQQTIGSVRTVEDIRKFLQIPNTNLHTAWDRTGQLAAYAVEGKGADLTNYVHEWGGQVPALMALLSHIRQSAGKPITVITPKQSVNLGRALSQVASTNNQGFLGMIKILNAESLINKVKRHARTLGYADFIFEKRDEQFVFGFAQEVIAIADEKELVRVLFGPDFQWPHPTQAARQKLDLLLPLPLWFWGWDSV
jgi:hypothetical protein